MTRNLTKFLGALGVVGGIALGSLGAATPSAAQGVYFGVGPTWGWRHHFYHRPFWRGAYAYRTWHRPFWRGAYVYHRPFWRGAYAFHTWHRPFWRGAYAWGGPWWRRHHWRRW